jgi:hypothetical protein
MGGGGQPSSTTTTNVSQPPEYLEGPIRDFMRQAQELSGTPFSAYGGERVAGLTPQHYQGIDQAANAPTLGSATNLVDRTLQGDYFNNNPYLDQAYNRAAGAVGTSALNSAFGDASGLSNSGARTELQNQYNNLASDIYGGNYMQERQNQLSVLPYASQLPEAQSRLSLGAGDVLRNYDQDRINNQRGMFEERRTYPYQQLDVLGSAIGSSMGGGFGTQTQQSPYFKPSSTASMLGGGLAGLDLFRGLNS